MSNKHYLDLTGLSYFWSKIKEFFNNIIEHVGNSYSNDDLGVVKCKYVISSGSTILTHSSSTLPVKMWVDGVPVTPAHSYTFSSHGYHTVDYIFNDITDIGYATFSSVPRLKAVKLPESLTKISGTNSFYLSGIEEIEIPKGVTSIGAQALSSSSLSKIIARPTTAPTLGSSALNGVATIGTLYYPKGSDYSTWISALPSGWTAQPVDTLAGLTNHELDNTIHVTSNDKTTWNGKQDKIYSVDYIGKFYRSNVSGSGNINVSAAGGTIILGQFPTVTGAGTYIVKTYMKSSTSSYNLNVSFGGNTYQLSASSGIIEDSRELTVPANSTWSGSLANNVASGTIISIKILSENQDVTEIGTTAVTNDYDDLDNKPTIPTKVSDLTNDSGFTTNTGTITGITMNGVSKGTSGVVDLGTVVTENPVYVTNITIDELLGESLTSSTIEKLKSLRATSPINKLLIFNSNNSGGTSAIGTIITYGSSFEMYVYYDGDNIHVHADPSNQNWSITRTSYYHKPDPRAGIPKSDLSPEVQTSLGKADTALQSFTETDPVFTASVAHDITSGDVTNWNGKLDATATAKRAASIPYGACDNSSTATAYTATVPGITALEDGTCMLLKNGVVTSTTNFTININNLGAKPVYSNLGTGNSSTPTSPTRESAVFGINYTFLFVYNTSLVSGGCWILYRGFDANDIGVYIRTNNGKRTTKTYCGRYKILFSSPDNTQWIPSTTSTSTASTEIKDVTTEKINPFGRIVYYASSVAKNADEDIPSGYTYDQYPFALSNAFNRIGGTDAILTADKPVYIKCTYQSDGSAIIDPTTPYVQDLPNTEDGKIYIYLCRSYSTSQVELELHHPVYYYKGGQIRLWTGVETDNTPASGSNNLITSGGVYTALAGKQGTLTFDDTPTQNSTNPVKSSGIYAHTSNSTIHITSSERTAWNGKSTVIFRQW